MDNLCHSLAGAALGEAGLKHRTARGMVTLVIASNLPDIDVAVFATDTLAMSFRRGWTHGVLALAVLPGLLAAVVLAWDRLWPRVGGAAATRPPAATFAALALLAYIGTWLHVFMDWLNSYGVRLLMPFSNRWFYGDALYIVDPLLYLVFGLAIVVARWRQSRRHPAPTAPARAGLLVAAVYMAAMLASNAWARAEVRVQLARAGLPVETRFMVTPVFGNPIRREVIVDAGARYEKGLLWFEPAPHFRPLGYGVDTRATEPEVVGAVAATPRFQAYLRWSRFPFFVIERGADGTTVFLNDYRYSGPTGQDGWSASSARLPR